VKKILLSHAKNAKNAKKSQRRKKKEERRKKKEERRRKIITLSNVNFVHPFYPVHPVKNFVIIDSI